MYENEKKDFNNLTNNTFHPMFEFGIEKDIPRLDMISSNYDRLFFDAKQNAKKLIINKNIVKDDFDNFNKKIQDNILRDLHNNDFISTANRSSGINLMEKQKNEYFINKIKNKNCNYETRVNEIKEYK